MPQRLQAILLDKPMTPPPQCNSCGKVMVEVGRKQEVVDIPYNKQLEIVKTILILFQCEVCKDIKLV